MSLKKKLLLLFVVALFLTWTLASLEIVNIPIVSAVTPKITSSDWVQELGGFTDQFVTENGWPGFLNHGVLGAMIIDTLIIVALIIVVLLVVKGISSSKKQ